MHRLFQRLLDKGFLFKGDRAPCGTASQSGNPPRKVSGFKCNWKSMRAGHGERRAGGHAPAVGWLPAQRYVESETAFRLNTTPRWSPTMPPKKSVSTQDTHS